MMIRILLIILGLSFLNSYSCAQESKMTKEQCLHMAKVMIAEGKRNIARSTRPDDVQQWRTLTANWQKRLDDGDAPCAVYADIFNISTKM